MDTNMDRSWLKNQHGVNYLKGIQGFIRQAKDHLDKNGRTPCPCTKCINVEYRHIDDVRRHLVEFGMQKDYIRWVYHGEPEVHSDDSDDDDEDDVDEDDKSKQEREKLFKDLVSVRDHMDRGMLYGESGKSQKGSAREKETADNVSDENGKSKGKILTEAQQPLYPGSNGSKLDFLVKMLHIKVNHGWSDESFDACLEFVKSLLPEGETLPKSFDEAKAMIEEIKRSQGGGSGV